MGLFDLLFGKNKCDETVVLLSKGNMSSKHIQVEFDLEKMDTSGFKDGAT